METWDRILESELVLNVCASCIPIVRYSEVNIQLEIQYKLGFEIIEGDIAAFDH
jgi:hypothetical protein